MKKVYTGIPARVKPLVEKAAAAAGCTVWDIEFVKEGPDHILRITIDKDSPEGVGIDDCEAVHRALDPMLDEADPIESSYLLQVSSPGIERELTLPEHVSACAGERAQIRLFAPVDGRKVYEGDIGGISADLAVTLITDGGNMEFPFESISKMKLIYDFSSEN